MVHRGLYHAIWTSLLIAACKQRLPTGAHEGYSARAQDLFPPWRHATFVRTSKIISESKLLFYGRSFYSHLTYSSCPYHDVAASAKPAELFGGILHFWHSDLLMWKFKVQISKVDGKSHYRWLQGWSTLRCISHRYCGRGSKCFGL